MKYTKKLPIIASLSLFSLGVQAEVCDITNPNQAKPAHRLETPELSIPSNSLKNAYFGEQHMHTMYSLDAYMGENRVTPDMAYRFAKGEPVAVPGGMARLHKPLDFVAITDHAEFFGESYASTNPDSHEDGNLDNKLYYKPESILIRNPTNSDFVSEFVFLEIVQKANRYGEQSNLGKLAGCNGRHQTWQRIQDATNTHNKPGEFTALHAFEWSSAPNSANLHRNVIFRDDKVPYVPFSALDDDRPYELWQQLQAYEDQLGTRVLAIPHNSNYSSGFMFPTTDHYESKNDDGTMNTKSINQDWVETRAQFERAVEIMQVKQNSETNTTLNPLDEFADFETFDITTDRLAPRTGWVREGLKEGLQLKAAFGTNPYQLGFVGGTDNHNGLTSDVEEYDWKGAHGTEDTNPSQRATGEVPGWLKVIHSNPGALTGVWAPKNTRADIWDAIYNRETFATSGTRMRIRFFAGDYPSYLHTLESDRGIKQAYDKGVPMGGELQASGSGPAPKFMVMAMKDGDSANLDRIQIIKGWMADDEDGDDQPDLHEKIYDVVWADPENRTIDAISNQLTPIENTVNVAEANYTNTVGAPVLATTWSDPDYDPTQAAFYYARALEIHTPRWTTYDAQALSQPIPDGVPATIQERAWSSPIWIKPAE